MLGAAPVPREWGDLDQRLYDSAPIAFPEAATLRLMIRCSCCERRVGNSNDPCECDLFYCVDCRLCDLHCTCADELVEVNGLDRPRRFPVDWLDLVAGRE